APIDKGWRQERVRVALPKPQKLSSETALRNTDRNHVSEGAQGVPEEVVEGAPDRDMPKARGALPARKPMLPPVPPDCPEHLVEKMGADILAKVERMAFHPARHRAAVIRPRLVVDPGFAKECLHAIGVLGRALAERQLPRGVLQD